jgi:hypothetical protein
LGHIVCREGVLVDPKNFVVILNMPHPMNAKRLQTTLGHTRYYRLFIRNYTCTTTPLEKLLKKYETFTWKPKCDQAFDTLKENLSTGPILIYPNWNVEFHVHIDPFSIALGAILWKPSEGNLDHPIYFTSRKIS